MIPRLSWDVSRAGWRGLLRSFRLLMSGELAARLLGFASVFVLARAIEPAGFGIVSLGTTLVIFFTILVDAGTEVLNVRDIARQPGRLREIAEPVLGLRLTLSVPAAALFGATVFVAADEAADRLTLGVFALVLPMAALNLRWMVLGVGASKAIAVGSVAKELLVLAGVVVLVRERHDTLIVAVLVAAGELANAAVVLYALYRRFGFLRPRVHVRIWSRILRDGRPVLINNVARTVVFSLDVLLIALFLGRESVGLYSAAYKPVLFALSALSLFFVSFLAHYSAAAGEDARQLFRRTVAVAVGVTVPAAAVAALASGQFVRIAYGDAFTGAAAAMAVLVWTLPILAVSGAYRHALIAGHREHRLMRNNLVGALFNAVANLAAIPLAGIVGAAAVTIASEALITALNVRAVVGYELERSPVTVLAEWLRWHVPVRSGSVD